MIFHIAQLEDWRCAEKQGEYRIPGLLAEGFIHCSTVKQFIPVAHRLFKGRKDLILLEIDETLVQAPIKYEGETAEKFPHIYGPINLGAVNRTHEFVAQSDGTFLMPSTVTS